MKKAVCVIPARLASSRLPGKLLLNETGKPLLVHTIEAAMACERFERVIVAHDPDIEAATLSMALRDAGHEQQLQAPGECPVWIYKSGPGHLTGTDRIAALVNNKGQHVQPHFAGIDIVVNLQADEPEISPDALSTLVQLIEDGAEMATLARRTPIRHGEYDDPNVVKVLDAFGEAIAFTRRDVFGLSSTWQPHIGAYAFTRDALSRFAAHGPTRYETTNRLEQLRAFQLDPPLRIALGLVEHEGNSINTRADYDVFVERYKARTNG